MIRPPRPIPPARPHTQPQKKSKNRNNCRAAAANALPYYTTLPCLHCMRSAESSALHEPTTPLPTTRQTTSSCILSLGSGKANGEATATRLSAAIRKEGRSRLVVQPYSLASTCGVCVGMYRGAWCVSSAQTPRHLDVQGCIVGRYSISSILYPDAIQHAVYLCNACWVHFQNHSQSRSFMHACLPRRLFWPRAKTPIPMPIDGCHGSEKKNKKRTKPSQISVHPSE